MATDLSKSSIQQVVDLVNTDNSSTLTTTDIGFGVPVPLVGDPSGKNTSVVINSIANSGYSGSVSINYDRLDLEGFVTNYGAVELNIPDDGGMPAILTAFNTQYGSNLQLDVDIFNDPSLPEISYEPTEVTLTAISTSLAYINDVVIDVAYASTHLNTIIVNVDLDGLSFPDLVSWLLPAANLPEQRFALEIISVKPNADLPAFCYQLNTHPNVPYILPIGAIGGLRPYRYRLKQAPTGATITEVMDHTIDPTTNKIVFSPGDSYGVIEWLNPSGNATFEIEVTDQNENVQEVLWTTTENIPGFVFVNANPVVGNDANAGTWEAPLQTFSAGLWKSDRYDATFANKIACFLDGVYEVYQEAPGSSVGLDLDYKPSALIGLGSNVEFDTTQGMIYVNTGNVAIMNIRFNGTPNEANPRVFSVNRQNDNFLFYKCRFANTSMGTDGGDNPGAILFMEDVDWCENITVIDCHLESTCETQLLGTFASRKICVERCTALDVDMPLNNGSFFIQIKATSRDCSIAYCRSRGHIPQGHIRFGNQNQGRELANQEVIFNFVHETTREDWEDGAINFNQGGLNGNAANTYCGRNTIISPTYAISGKKWVDGDNVDIYGNAYVAAGLAYGPGYTDVGDNVEFEANEIVDGELVGTARTTYLGLVGCEIAV